MCVSPILWKYKHGVPRKEMQFRRGGMAGIEPLGSVFHLGIRTVELHSYKKIIASMDKLTIKTPNPICRLFFKIDLLTDFAALCLTDFIGWRCIHSCLVFSTQLVNCCPHGQRNYICVLLPLYLLYDLPPNYMNSMYSMWLWGGGGGGVELCCRPYSAGVLHSVSDQIWNLQNCFTTPKQLPVKTTLVSLKFLRPWLQVLRTGDGGEGLGAGWGKYDDALILAAFFELFCLPRNSFEWHSECLLLFLFHGTEVRVFFSSAEWFRT